MADLLNGVAPGTACIGRWVMTLRRCSDLPAIQDPQAFFRDDDVLAGKPDEGELSEFLQRVAEAPLHARGRCDAAILATCDMGDKRALRAG